MLDVTAGYALLRVLKVVYDIYILDQDRPIVFIGHGLGGILVVQVRYPHLMIIYVTKFNRH